MELIVTKNMIKRKINEITGMYSAMKGVICLNQISFDIVKYVGCIISQQQKVVDYVLLNKLRAETEEDALLSLRMNIKIKN